LPDAVHVQRKLAGKIVAVSIGLGYGGIALSDVDCAHDSHSEDPLHPEYSRVACLTFHSIDHGNWHYCALHIIRGKHRPSSIASELLPLACHDTTQLLHTDTDHQGNLRPKVQDMALIVLVLLSLT